MAEEAEQEVVEETGAEAAPEVVSETETQVASAAPEFNATEALAKLRESIQDESLRKHAERFQSFDDIVKGHSDLRKNLSKAIIPPGPDAKPSEVAEYRKKLGVPEKVEDYKFDIPDELKEVVETEAVAERLKTVAEIAHANNIPNAAFGQFINAYFQMTLEDQAALAEADGQFLQQSQDALKKHWGAQYNAEMEYAKRGAQWAAGDDFEEFSQLQTADGRLIGDHPLMAKIFNKIGRATSEDSVMSIASDPASQSNLRAELADLTAQQADMQARGDHQQAQALDLKIMEVARKLSGDNPIVGAGAAA